MTDMHAIEEAHKSLQLATRHLEGLAFHSGARKERVRIWNLLNERYAHMFKVVGIRSLEQAIFVLDLPPEPEVKRND